MKFIFIPGSCNYLLLPVAASSKASVFVRSLAGIAGSNPAEDIDFFLLNVVCCQVEISASG
jgi:hypothetical protein